MSNPRGLLTGRPTTLIYKNTMIIGKKFQQIFAGFTPQLLDIKFLNTLRRGGLYIYGEIHGARQNADIVFTLCRSLNVRRLAIEYSDSIDRFLMEAVDGRIDPSLIGNGDFDSSILSIEMLKTIVEAIRSGDIQDLAYIDDTFDYTDAQWSSITDPDWREVVMAQNILELDTSVDTLCIMGNWHTRTAEVNGHVSALMRVREKNPQVISINVSYGGGMILNCGSIMSLPESSKSSSGFSIVKKAPYDFVLLTPRVDAIRSGADS